MSLQCRRWVCELTCFYCIPAGIHFLFPAWRRHCFYGTDPGKLFLQKLSQMPKEECEVTAITEKEPVKAKKTNAGILYNGSFNIHFV